MDLADILAKLKTTQIPFFPSNLHEKRPNVSVWWFEKDFSQSFYGKFASRQSNSCTLIMLLTAARIHMHKIETKAVGDQLSFDLIKAFAESIVEGNEIYFKLRSSNLLKDINLSIPDAIDAVKNSWKGLKELFYATIHLLSFQNGMKESIFTGLIDGFNRWQLNNSVKKTENHLFVILIASSQSILFVFEKDTSMVTTFDSHQHLSIYGSVIAQTDTENLKYICLCIERMHFDVYASYPEQMELSFLECNEADPKIVIKKFVQFVDP